MDRRALKKLLEQVRGGAVTVAAAEERLRHFPMDELGFAAVDTHRALRRGFPETVYGPGKTSAQILAIVSKLHAAAQTALVTRVGPETHAVVASRHPEAEYHAEARALVLRSGPKWKGRPGVVVMTAGTTDIGVAEEAALTAELMGEQVRRVYDVGVAGLHRLLAVAGDIGAADAVIVIAGMEGALASVVGGLTGSPVIAVPTSVGYGASLAGVTALLAMLSACAPGITVVGIDNGYGAACAVARLFGGVRPAAVPAPGAPPAEEHTPLASDYERGSP